MTLISQEIAPGDEPMRFDRMLAKSPLMKEIFRQILVAASTEVPVLITGETGTGKELVAKSIHERSNRAKGPFLALNTGSLAPDLVSSELFGHAKGAFTGATGKYTGKIGQAQNGTLFLDEVEVMHPRTQVSLLRFIESGEYSPVGGSGVLKSNARLIAASNADLSALVRQGTFRADLFYRLEVFTLRVPSLRERTGAIPYLCREFIKESAATYGLPVEGVTLEALKRLEAHDWPGNIRELKNVLQRAVLLARKGKVGIEHVAISGVGQAGPCMEDTIALPKGLCLREAARCYLMAVLEACGGNKLQAARSLGISRKALYGYLGSASKRGIHKE